MKMNLVQRFPAVCLLGLALVTAGVSGCTDSSPEAHPAPHEAVEQETPQVDGRLVPRNESGQRPGRSTQLPAGVPAKVGKVLGYIDEHQQPPEGYEGGRPFGNHEDKLPKGDARGRTIRYQEWDVNPKMPGKNRGPERLVTDSDGSAYYTPDHYKSFIKIR